MDDELDSMRPFSPQNRRVWGLGVRWLVASTVVVVVLALVFGVLGVALGWYNAATDVVSPENVKAQYQDAYSNFEALKATAGDVCSARAAVTAETDPDARTQRVSQELAYEQNYRRIAASYDAAYDNAFQAKHVGPTDLPHTAPDLNAELKVVGCG
ncbi:MAG TPA: hypothetical protein VGN81_41595 [Pseudonocardiaceae bacterium]|jgi:hypothetical protein